MKPDTKLATIFTDGNIVELDGHFLLATRTPPRTVGGANFNTQLSGMTTRALYLRLDGRVHSFKETKRTIGYIEHDVAFPRVIQLERCDPPRVIAIRRIDGRRFLTLLLIDERIGKPIAVIGENLAWHLDGLDVQFATERGETIHEM
jgi:hypothetical protein